MGASPRYLPMMFHGPADTMKGALTHGGSPESPDDGETPDEAIAVEQGAGKPVRRTELPQVLEASRPRMVFDPTVVRVNANAFRVHGMRDDRHVTPWGFYGGLLIAVVALMVVLFRGATGLYSTWDLFWVVLAISVGAIMLKVGRKSSLRRELLCEVDTLGQMLLFPANHDDPNSTMLAIPFEEVSELVFGMTRYPISERRVDVKVHAFTLLVRDAHDRLIPVVEASPNKQEVHQIGSMLAQLVGMPMTYVGHGVR